ncbi:MAG: hypothetical protein ACPG7F_12790, partial [Aggregatilineales bacterium]
RPDYIASYGRGHGYGLYMLEESALYDNPQAIFTVDLQPHLNVALAADTQGIYQSDWLYTVHREDSLWSTYALPDGAYTFRTLNVADIVDEAKYDYQFESASSGFPTVLSSFDNVLDAYRVLNGEESFTFELDIRNPAWMVLITRVHASAAGTLDIYVNNEFVDRQWIPEMPGQWFNISTLIDPKYLEAEKMEIRIVPTIPDGYYMPAYHVIRRYAESYTGFHYHPSEYGVLLQPGGRKAAIFQEGAFHLTTYETEYFDRLLTVSMGWLSYGQAEGDYRLFVHLYDDINQQPVAQWDDYIAGMPPGNWFIGHLRQNTVIDIADVASGTYQLAIGFYNPYTNERLMPESDFYEVLPDGRLLLDSVEIE